MVNPIFRIIVLNSGRVTAALTGRLLRKWWQRQPPERKQFISKHMLNNKWKYVGTTGLLGYFSYDSYRNQIAITPFTNRERFMALNNEDILDISDNEYKQIYYANRNHVFRMDHVSVIKIRNVVQSIVTANKDIPKLFNMYWSVTIIDKPHKQCSILQNGRIIITTGMIKIISNIDQLAAVLAHEMSHVLLDHNAEKLSNDLLVNNLVLLPILLMWAFLPTDLLAAACSALFGTGLHFLYELPYSRTLEEEADVVGLFLMASACYDVREASALWGKMDILETTTGEKKWYTDIDWLSTHPSHINRQCLLNNFMEEAFKIRCLKRCPKLKNDDPREFIDDVRQKLPGSMQPSAISRLSLRDDFKNLNDAAKQFVELKSKR